MMENVTSFQKNITSFTHYSNQPRVKSCRDLAPGASCPGDLLAPGARLDGQRLAPGARLDGRPGAKHRRSCFAGRRGFGCWILPFDFCLLTLAFSFAP